MLAISAMFGLSVHMRNDLDSRTGQVTTHSADGGLAASVERLDRALNRLETSVRALSGRMRSVARLEGETQRLAADRARLAGDLDRATARADQLDAVAGDVSRRLVDAMETVRAVMDEGTPNG